MRQLLLFSILPFIHCQSHQVNQCVLRCKDNHMREMDNEWSTDFTLPLLSLLQATGNETAALVKFQAICRSNELLEGCLSRCNKSLEVSILLAGSKSWSDSCDHLEDVQFQFTCWKRYGNELLGTCRPHTVHLRESLIQLTRNQSEQNIQNICSDYDKFSTCFMNSHGRLCGVRSEVISGRMAHSNREAIFTMLKIKFHNLPAQCGYSHLRRDTSSTEKLSYRSVAFSPCLTILVVSITVVFSLF